MKCFVHKQKCRKRGFTLVEIMISILVLTVLVVGGAAALYHTGGGIQRQQNKREAIVAANSELEKLWSTTYTELGSAAGTTNVINVSVNGRTLPLSTAVSEQVVDANGDRYYELSVSVSPVPNDTVVLTSRRYERGLSKARVN